ncbi:MAG: protein-L-isoaspartate(D-aspartate) O-methyltransferase [Betaproteobacteria bacterium]|nr:MAG: protein-L-isoaspartate(D-aspartate) O-methyltransferase [Betaproteobacteria bacterium]
MIERVRGIGMTSERTRLRMVERLRAAGVRDEAVLAAMARIPRHIFVDDALASRAYEDMALPLGHGQTISHPLTVARMCELARAGRSLGRVLEIGTGCGYQAAVLSCIAREVFSVERIASLLEHARVRILRELRLRNVRMKHADGREGLPEAAPFDAIVMAAAAAEAPPALIEQLAPGGRMVMPLGNVRQRLCLIERSAAGVADSILEEVNFVPLRAGVLR